MMWFPYLYLLLTLIILLFMPKRLTKVEIYVTWFVVALINLSSDLILSFVFHMYELGPKGVQLSVHFIELTLGATHGIIYLNFMPQHFKSYIPIFALGSFTLFFWSISCFTSNSLLIADGTYGIQEFIMHLPYFIQDGI
ncbi:hypothetical protein A499_13731 [Niallia nealsonii AAU1]|nr:hypothetical protein A499_13731 [Niallia nealsonii AAU1]